VLTVSEVSKLANVTADTVRHYVQLGLLTPTRNPSNGYKLFKDDDVKLLKFICLAKGLGFTLSDISKILNHSNKAQSPCPTVREIIEQRIVDNKQKLSELNALQARMENALKMWKNMPDGEPDGDAICHLIEAIKVV